MAYQHKYNNYPYKIDNSRIEIVSPLISNVNGVSTFEDVCLDGITIPCNDRYKIIKDIDVFDNVPINAYVVKRLSETDSTNSCFVLSRLMCKELDIPYEDGLFLLSKDLPWKHIIDNNQNSNSLSKFHLDSDDKYAYLDLTISKCVYLMTSGNILIDRKESLCINRTDSLDAYIASYKVEIVFKSKSWYDIIDKDNRLHLTLKIPIRYMNEITSYDIDRIMIYAKCDNRYSKYQHHYCTFDEPYTSDTDDNEVSDVWETWYDTYIKKHSFDDDSCDAFIKEYTFNEREYDDEHGGWCD